MWTVVVGAAIRIGASHDDDHGHDGGADLSWVEIDLHGLVNGKEAALVPAKTHRERHPVLLKAHECDLQGAIHIDLHGTDSALKGGTTQGPANDNVPTGRREEKRQSDEYGKKEARHGSPPTIEFTPV